MAEEDRVADELHKAIVQVVRLPRPSIRQKILMDTMLGIAKYLGVEVEWKEPKQ